MEKKVGWDTDEIRFAKLNGVEVVSQVSESYFKALLEAIKPKFLKELKCFIVSLVKVKLFLSILFTLKMG